MSLEGLLKLVWAICGTFPPDWRAITQGSFIAGKDSIVVPLRYLQVNQARSSFFLRLSSAEVKTVPLMSDHDYLWLADEEWRATNAAIFQNLIPNPTR